MIDILLAIGAGYYFKRFFQKESVRTAEWAIFLLLAFISGGFSETIVAAQIAILGIVLLVSFAGKSQFRKNRIWLSGAGLVGSLLSLVVNLLSPGNLIRAGDALELSSASNLWSRFYESFVQAVVFIPNWFVNRTVVAAFALLIGMFINLFYWREFKEMGYQRTIKRFMITTLIIFIGVWASLSPSFVIRGFAPPERALLIPYFLTSCLAVYWGWLGAGFLRNFLSSAHLKWLQVAIPLLLYIVLYFGPVSTGLSGIKFLPDLQTYSRMWDERDQFLRESAARGEKHVTVTNFHRHEALRRFEKSSVWMLGDFDEEPTYWINTGAAWYYGLDTISSE
ncbi:MAG: hypothetical protein Kow002_19080 [Anaerolineales bacterium]